MPIKSNTYQKAERKATMLRAIFYGTDGTGKTYSALRLARHLVGDGDILVLDTEQVGQDAPRSAQYDQFGHYVDAMPMSEILANPATAYKRFIQRITNALESGAEAVIIDSWSDENVAYMTQAVAIGDDKAYYKTMKPLRVNLCEVIKNAPCHVILCQRAREKGVWQDGVDGRKSKIIRMAEQPEGSDAVGYAINIKFAMEDIVARTVKTIYEDFLPEGLELDMRTQWDVFADKIVTALDDGAETKERFKAELTALGYAPTAWRQLWKAIPELGEWSAERHEAMIQMVKDHNAAAMETDEPTQPAKPSKSKKSKGKEDAVQEELQAVGH